MTNSDIKDVYFDEPLYTRIKPSDFSLKSIDDLAQQLKDVPEGLDAYCIRCGRDSLFKGREINFISDDVEQNVFGIRFACSRNSLHEIFVFFYVSSDYIIKIGQYPSLADLKIQQNKRFSKVLPKEVQSELSRAVGLSAHGIGIGSFVYLRRIFEKLVLAAFEEFSHHNTEITPQDFYKMRMGDKIQLLSDFLPPFLLENKTVYGILSKGIHDLSEEECLDYFGLIRESIEYMLEEKASLLEQKRRKERIQKEITRLSVKNSEGEK